MRRLREAIRL